jgi:hypothetical protein
MVEILILGKVSVRSEMNGTEGGCLSLGLSRGGGSLYTWRGALCQILLFPVSLWFPISVVRSSCISSQLHRFFPFPFSACTRLFGISCSLILLSVVNVLPTSAIGVVSLGSRLLEGKGRMVGISLCNVGATQPIGIFLPPPSRKSTQMCRFGILPLSRNSTQLCGFGIFNSFLHGPCNGFLPFPPSSSPFLPPPSVLPIIVWMGGLPAPDVLHSTYLLVLYSPWYPPPVPMIVVPSLST